MELEDMEMETLGESLDRLEREIATLGRRGVQVAGLTAQADQLRTHIDATRHQALAKLFPFADDDDD